MVENNKNIILRIYVVAVVIFLMAVAIVLKITNIQWVEGDSLRKLANKHSIQNFVIPANTSFQVTCVSSDLINFSNLNNMQSSLLKKICDMDDETACDML